MKNASQKTSANTNTANDGLNDWIKNVSPNKVINNAQRILGTAIDVLEEEIAAGILAAKQLEKKVINVDEIRSAAPEELMSRIRRDAHDAVDLFIDAVTALTNQITSLTQPANGTRSTKETKRDSNEIAVVQNDVPAKPGQSIDLPVLITNHSSDKAMQVEFAKSELIGPLGNKIPAKAIQVIPKSFMLAPGEAKEVIINITIPATAKPGSYSGLFQDINNPQLKTVLTIEVA
ncbi:MAG: hypothetical protein JWR72_1554 [Flavisolibacter sp.]|jgi:hypothetical protein|nr:hypothetical protein [Flavisolibacter sp.]